MNKQTFASFVLGVFGLITVSSCIPFDQEAYDKLGAEDAARVQFFTNAAGTRPGNERDRKPTELLVEAIDRAQVKLDVCVYGFSRQQVIDAVVRAHYRGVQVRVVGDARHFGYGERGYRAMQEHRIPMQVGNQFHIMHNKFFVIDDRFTFVGTGNITTTGFTKNNNNWILIDSLEVADDFGQEFEQMFGGRFSAAKIPNFNGNKYQVGDTTVEVLFSPHEDTMGKMLEELDKAHTSVHFQIFAFTKDQVGSRFIRLHQKFTEFNRQQGMEDAPVISLGDQWSEGNADSKERPKKVVGILDKSQVHGNAQYHEVYRMVSNDIPMRIDANINSYTPGDYQAGGGRLHTKTMILDYGTPDARIVTGSFNWSSSATIANDEVLMVLRGERIVEQFMQDWRELWIASDRLPDGLCNANLAHQNSDFACASDDDIGPGSVIISEVHWDGWNGDTDPSDQTGFRDDLTNDEFIELYNTTDKMIDLSLWTINNGHDATMGFTPGTVIAPKSHFVLVDHNIPPFSEANPIRNEGVFQNADFVLNTINDPRFPRLNLKNTAFRIELRAPRDTTMETFDSPNIIDAVGDLGPPYAGGRVGQQTFSMERKRDGETYAADGEDPANWASCSSTEGNENVVEKYRDIVIATPGEWSTND